MSSAVTIKSCCGWREMRASMSERNATTNILNDLGVTWDPVEVWIHRRRLCNHALSTPGHTRENVPFFVPCVRCCRPVASSGNFPGDLTRNKSPGSCWTQGTLPSRDLSHSWSHWKGRVERLEITPNLSTPFPRFHPAAWVHKWGHDPPGPIPST